MKILYITTIGATMSFFKSFIKELIDDGNIVDLASNDSESKVPQYFKNIGCNTNNLKLSRNPLYIGNISAVTQIRNLVKTNQYNIVHCHTPIAAACTRIACRKLRKKGTKVFYTAHGFHFYKGAPLKNWLLYFPIEWICSFFTDVLITINTEDYEFAKKHLHAKQTEYVPGVGIDINRFQGKHFNSNQIRKQLGIKEDDFMVLSVGELNSNKNHKIIIEALIKINNPHIHYVIAGEGELRNYLQMTCESNHLNLHLLGYRRDIPELLSASDLFILPSLREGLNVSLMESMAAGTPCICSDIRGNRDLIIENKGGYRVKPTDIDGFVTALNRMISDKNTSFTDFNKIRIKKFTLEKINLILKKLYSES